MSDSEDIVQPLLPLATKTLRLQPGDIVPAVEDSPYVVHFTMAAIDLLNPSDQKKQPSTLRLIRIQDSESEEEEDEDEDEDEDEEDEAKRYSKIRDSEDSEPVTLLTLSPNSQFQQPMDLYVAPTEGLCFEVIGSYPIHLSGNIVDHPLTQELLDEEEESGSEDEDQEEDSSEDDEDIPDAIDIAALDDEEDDSESEDSEDELDEIQDDDDSDDSEEEETPRISEVKESDSSKKRSTEEPAKQRPSEDASKVRSSKENAKKRPADESPSDKKKVKFSESLEKGPTEAPESKFPTKKLEGGVIIEDRKPGDGPSAKKGSRVSMRYVGKLVNGKVFDKNTSGKPFTFSLGLGEVIRGWDIGIAGMKAGGERRIIIPAPMAYGKQSLPGIPKNSELRFDVKCLSIK